MNGAREPIYDPKENGGHGTVPQAELTPTLDLDLEFRRKARRLPTFLPPAAISASTKSASKLALKIGASATVVLLSLVYLAPSIDENETVRLAMVGNSLMYFNDLPRLLETMSEGHIVQDSCLHGNADFWSHLWYGNGMYDKWMSGQARIRDAEGVIYDYGACTVQELLFGKDERIDEDWVLNVTDDSIYNATDPPQDAWVYEVQDDGTNPCLVDEDYKNYRKARYLANGRPQWDFVLLNDNTRSACCTDQRQQSMELLEDVYLPWFEEIQAVPIFMVTYGYMASKRDMSAFSDVADFASLTYNGYLDYYELALEYLPKSLKPRIAPVGLAFLLVWEENPSMWEDLMHYDEIHLSPSGTFLQACVVYHTIFGRLPDPSVYQGGEGPDYLWRTARRIAPVEDGYKPFPSRAVADYLYHIAFRICVKNEIPKSLIFYPLSTSISFTPDDSHYSETAVQDGAAR